MPNRAQNCIPQPDDLFSFGDIETLGLRFVYTVSKEFKLHYITVEGCNENGEIVKLNIGDKSKPFRFRKDYTLTAQRDDNISVTYNLTAEPWMFDAVDHWVVKLW
jgi:hypothetical protein